MKNQVSAAITGLVSSVDWDRKDLDLQGLIDAVKLGEVREPLTDWLASRAWKKHSRITRLISGAETLELDETDGKATIARAKDTFTGWIDPDFKGYGCDVESEPTKKMQVTVHEMIKDGTFAKIFGGMSDDLNKLVMTQSQIIQFVKKHKKWLRMEGYATFFLFKVGEEFFVAGVGLSGDGLLGVYVSLFSGGNVWDAGDRHRIVTPQLVPVALAN